MSILIAGTDGFIGSFLKNYLKDKQYLLMLTFSYFGAHFPNSKLKKQIKFEPEYTWQDGVKEAVKSYLL